MQYKGINYDTGTRTITGRLTRELFDPAVVAREVQIIKNELYCNAIRISGYELERVVKAAEIALKEGLSVWFSPSLHYANKRDVREYILRGAAAAEDLRARYGNLVFVVGGELTLFAAGFIKGSTGEDRIKSLFGPFSLLKNVIGLPRGYNIRLRDFLSEVVGEVRKLFNGQVTYASGPWEKIDWSLFDIIGIDHYRSGFNNATYRKELQRYKAFGKPLSIMEFGCCTYKGAEDKGGMGWAIVDWKKERPALKGEYVRDEEVQARCLQELLDIFDAEQVYAAFVFTFILANYRYDEDPRYDLDMASYGIVKALEDEEAGYDPGLRWLPKKSFFGVAAYYSGRSGGK